MNRIAPALCLAAAFLMAGCGGSSSSSSPTSTPATTASRLVTYTDKHYHFSFQHPASWLVPASGGRHTMLSGVASYVLTIVTPNSSEGVELTVDRNLQSYQGIVEGKTFHDPGGGPSMFQAHHLKVAGWPAIQFRRFNGSVTDEYDTIVNTAHYSFDVKIKAANPPLSASALQGYNTILRTLQPPF